MATESALYLGTSGWSYEDWVGPFYPAGTAKQEYLSFYVTRFNAVEIDSTFYATPSASLVRRWRELAPAGFRYCPKLVKTITHDKVLVDCEDELASFVGRMAELDAALGPILIQFPYSFKRHEQWETLERFLGRLPEGFRFALEVRHKSWLDEAFYDLLREHGVALCLIDHPWMPWMEETTTDFTYIRWLGDRKAIPDDFSHVRIDRAERIARWAELVERVLARDQTVYGFFNNHYAGHSPANVEQLLTLLERRSAPPGSSAAPD